MKAIRQHRFGDPDVLELEEVDDLQPAPGTVRIAVEAAGVHLLDTSIRAGESGGPFPLPDLPMTPGREVAGRIDAVGPDVEAGWLGRRVVAHGMGKGGEMAYYLGFHARAVVRGVATVGAVLTSNPKERVAGQPLAFFVVAGGKDPLRDAIADTVKKLLDQKYPVVLREVAEMGHQYIDGGAGVPVMDGLVRWIDSLDRL